jgi:hypothetical protein
VGRVREEVVSRKGDCPSSVPTIELSLRENPEDSGVLDTCDAEFGANPIELEL